MRLPHILIVDDEPNLADILSDALTEEGYEVDATTNGMEVIDRFAQRSYDALLLDLKMESIDGLEVLRHVREYHPDVIVIILTGHGSMESAVAALRYGAFDYRLKPTSPQILHQLIQKGLQHRQETLRRQQLISEFDDWYQVFKEHMMKDVVSSSATENQRFITSGQLSIDRQRSAISLDGKTLDLTKTEFSLLICLVQASPETLSPRQLVNLALGYDCDDTQAGDVIKWHIHHLRQKVEPAPPYPRYIKTVRGRGYVWRGNQVA